MEKNISPQISKMTVPDGHNISVYSWNEVEEPEAVLQIFHGMAEHAERYNRLARFLNSKGIIVIGNDHRGHGKTAQHNGKIGVIGKNGFYKIVEDEYMLTKQIKQQYDGIPVFILGHSFGSFVGQEYITRYGSEIAGIILSGTAAQVGAEVRLGKYLASIKARLTGEEKPARLIEILSFGTYNKRIVKPKTLFDWLSRDEAEVRKYIDDEYCGFTCSAGFYYYFLDAMLNLYKESKLGGIPKNLPVYILAGREDPVGGYGKKTEKLYDILRDLGLADLNMKLYKEARHEILNDINRQEVSEDILVWIKSHLNS